MSGEADSPLMPDVQSQPADAHEAGPSHDAPPIDDYLDRTRFGVDEWRLVEQRFSDENLGTTETVFALGNGYLGLRGNVEEGRESHSHGTFINGFHETWPIQHAEEAYGFASVGQTIVNVPDAKTMRLYVDDEPLLLPVADLLEYERVIDFRTGVQTRDLVWRTPAGKRVHLRTTRMVSLTQRHLAVMTLEVTMLDDAAPVAISSQILNRQDGEDEYHVPSKAMGEGVDPRKAERLIRRVLEPVLHNGDQDSWAGRARLPVRRQRHDARRRGRPRVQHRQRLHLRHPRLGGPRQDGLPHRRRARSDDQAHQARLVPHVPRRAAA